MKLDLKKFCYFIGCSGMDNLCPGNENCKIIRKFKKACPGLFDEELNKEPNG